MEVLIGLASVMVWINGKHVGGLVEYPEGWGPNSRLSTNYPELKGQHHDRRGVAPYPKDRLEMKRTTCGDVRLLKS